MVSAVADSLQDRSEERKKYPSGYDSDAIVSDVTSGCTIWIVIPQGVVKYTKFHTN
jgi:hypothetical protein